MKREKECFYKDIDVRFHECDKNERIKLQTVMAHMADIPGIAYAQKGYNHKWLWEHNSIFMLSRVSIHFNRTPLADERLTIETWEREVKGVIFYRDMVFYDENEIPVIECSTAWVLVSPITRSIIKPSSFTGSIDACKWKKANCAPPERLKMEGNFDQIAERKMVYSDIDGNNHVYNAVYAAIACDYLPESLIEREIDDFQINFKQEATLGDTMQVQLQQEKDSANIIGKLDEKISFECKFTFKKTDGSNGVQL